MPQREVRVVVFLQCFRPIRRGTRVGQQELASYKANGYEATRVVYDADDQPVRSESYTYWAPNASAFPGQVLRSAEHVYFSDANPSGAMHTFYHKRTPANNEWKLKRIKGDYLANRRLEFSSYDGVACPGPTHSLDNYSLVVVEEGTQRTEAKYNFHCDGRLDNYRANPLIVGSSPEPTPSVGWENWSINAAAANSSADVYHELTQFSNGNLQKIEYRLGSSPATYAVNYTWNNGMAQTARLDGINYDSRRVGTDGAGFVTASFDPNDLQTSYYYDANGNMVRLVAGGGLSATSWDVRNRMTAFYVGPEDATRRPMEHYLYDASGYRITRIPVNATGDGNPRLYLRDGSGQVLSQYIERPADGFPVLQKDFIYGLGQLLAERTVTEEIPEFSTDAAFFGSQGYCFNVQSNVGFDTYFVDIRTPSEYLNQITGVVPDATGKFCLAETQFALDETNYIRVRGESEEAQPYSRVAGGQEARESGV